MNKSVANINVNLEEITIKPSHQVPDCGSEFSSILADNGINLRRAEPTEIQINLGKLCNLACHHCHVDAGPNRTENMTWEIMEKILIWLDSTKIEKADLTGGAPELNPHFRRFCDELIARNIQITSRCNITVLFETQQEDLAQWYAERKIRLVCSLPCYTHDNVDAQRGKGVFDKSIAGLQLLNSLGYGKGSEIKKDTKAGEQSLEKNDHLILDLVYNPLGAFLPPEQSQLEQEYRHMLSKNFDITFSNLLAITNIPINRFAHSLRRDGKLKEYQELLVNNFNASTIDNLMCRHLYNVDWLGHVYDCDFNQMLNIPMGNKKPRFIWDIDNAKTQNSHIAVDRHCFGCTAGSGSSCSGTLT